MSLSGLGLQIFCSFTPSLLSSLIKWTWIWCQLLDFKQARAEIFPLVKYKSDKKSMVSVYSAVLYCNIFSRIVWAWVTDLAVTVCKTFAAVMTSQWQWLLSSRPSWNSLKQSEHGIISLLWPGHQRQLTPEASSTCQANSIFIKPCQEMSSVLIQRQN